MLVGYVSDERYVALSGVEFEFENNGELAAVVTSTPRGAVYADLEPGPYQVTLVKAGYGAKCVHVTIDRATPHQFRLLTDTLLGFVWPKWVRSGDVGEFRVHSPEAYRLSLWRYGMKREFVRLLGWHDEHGPRATVQITPDGDYSQTGVEWNRVGYGSPHHTQCTAAPERSGLYYFHAESESGAFFSFPWVVAPKRAAAPVALLASTNTWNAYNNYGGRSNYVCAAGLPPTPIVNARQDLERYRGGAFFDWRPADDEYVPLAFERPEPMNHIPQRVEATDPIRGRQGCHLAPAEWRLMAWLEREGQDYDLYADYQLHTGELDLDAYRVLILSTHPEYWSRDMYRRVKTWVDERGGRLLYLGGNGINCEVELDGGAMLCGTQLVTEDGSLGMPNPENPDEWLDSRFHRRVESEASLLGVVCTETGIMTAAPYRVSDGSHWVFEGTGLSTGDVFGEACLQERCSGGASGHETDKRSAQSPAGTVLLAKGLNPDDGGAEIVFYRRRSGGAVFSVGSITYPASLLVDPAISRITLNVLERFLQG